MTDRPALSSPPSSVSPGDSAELATAFLDQSHELLALTDGQGCLLWCNPAFCRATDLPLSASLLSLAPLAWQDGAPRQVLSDALASGAMPPAEIALVGRDGAPLSVRCRASRRDDHWIWTLQEVSDRRATLPNANLATVEADPRPQQRADLSLDGTEVYALARTLDSTAAQLKLAVDLGHIVIWRHDLATRLLHYNDHGFAVLGLPFRPQGLTLDEIRALTHPDDLPRVAESAQQALLTHAPVDVETRYRHANGSWRNLLVRRVIDRDESGKPRAYLGVALDVTDRHVAMEALRSTMERAALIAGHAGIGTWESAGPGRPALWDEKMYRLRGLEPRAEVPTIEERMALVHPDDRAVLLDHNPALHAAPDTLGYEFRVRLPDGQWRWLASRSTALRNDDGQVVRRVGVNWDISEAKDAEAARQQATLAERESQAKSWFLSRMSHELRTPLNAVLGFTQLLQQEARAANASERLTKLTHIRVAGEHLLALIDDALDLTSLQAGTLKLELQAVSLREAVSQVLPLVAEAAASQQVRVQAGRLAGTALADPTRLRQILLNLLTNAVKYNRAGGSVDIASEQVGNAVHLSVHDTGRGLGPEQLEHLFEPFNRLGAEADGIEGSGIGLTIVKALAEGMGGHVGVSSRLGQGTVFEVTLPTALPPAPGTSNAAATTRATADSGRRSGQLLYIEDNSVNVLLVEELVKSLPGLRIVSEGTGAEGVARALELVPDVILVDMQLPDFDGFEVLRRLRCEPSTARIPCIALSANAMPDDIERGLASGFDDYWTKPIRFKPFLSALERLFPEPGAAPTTPVAATDRPAA